jgi:integrase
MPKTKQTKRKTKQVQKKFARTEEIELHEGDVLIYRGSRSGKNWQFRMWVREDKKYFRKALGTKDKEIAIERANELYLETHHKLRSGIKVFDTTIGELANNYLKEQEDRIRVGAVGKGSIGITQGRYVTIRTQVKNHLCGFLGEQIKLSTIRSDTFRHKYTQYRRKKNPSVRDVTIINERATIGSVFRYALEKGLIQHSQLPLWEEMAKNADKREAFELHEWKEIYTYLRSWSKNTTNKKEKLERAFIRYFILLLTNTGLRFGELRLLRWGNVSIFKEDGLLRSKINVEIGKTGKRTVIGLRGDLFIKIKEQTSWKKKDDFVFADIDSGDQFKKKTLYKYWNEVIENTSLKNKQPKPVYYSLRHTYATFRLYADVPIDKLAKNMGCEVKFIETHYGHIDPMKVSKVLNQRIKNDDSAKFLLEI